LFDHKIGVSKVVPKCESC